LCYFLTRGINTHKLVNRIFWQGISLLDGFELIILLSTYDGASENRAFIPMNGSNAIKSQGFNPFSGWSIYSFCESLHYFDKKKLRNNLYNSALNKISHVFQEH